MAIVEVQSANFETEVLKSTQPVLVDFWAPWCGPCRALSPTIEKIASETEGKVKVVKVNVDDIPTIILFKEGKVVDTLVGLVPRERLEAFIKKSL